MYYANDNIKYDGQWINDEFDGYGEYIWENGEYYEGPFKNGLRHGKGKYFYSNGKIKYECKYINGKRTKGIKIFKSMKKD